MRTVRDVMTTDVVTVRGSTPYKAVVRSLREARVSALPVIDADGRLVGIVSGADLLIKEEHLAGEKHRFEIGRRRAEHEMAFGTLARDFMTTEVVTVAPDATIAEAARLMRRHSVKRLPVVTPGGNLIGIVGRGDLLDVFLRDDEEIRSEIEKDLIQGKLWLTPEEAEISVAVQDGCVRLSGRVDRKSLIPIVAAMVQGVDGVVGFVEELSFDRDDTNIHPPEADLWGATPHGPY